MALKPLARTRHVLCSLDGKLGKKNVLPSQTCQRQFMDRCPL